MVSKIAHLNIKEDGRLGDDLWFLGLLLMIGFQPLLCDPPFLLSDLLPPPPDLVPQFRPTKRG